MTEFPTTPAPRVRVRIYSHVTQARFLHVEDALGIGKIRLFAGAYRRGQGVDDHAGHYIDLADARVVFAALARGEPEFSYREYKGTPLSAGSDGHPATAGDAVSRVLSVQARGENIYIELKGGPGRLTATGAVTPAGKPQVAVNVGFKRYEAQRLAAVVLAYIHAWDVQRMMAHRQLVGHPAPYRLSAAETTDSHNEASTTVLLSPAVANDSPVAPTTAPPTPQSDGNQPATSPLATTSAGASDGHSSAVIPPAAASNGRRPVTNKMPSKATNDNGKGAAPVHFAVPPSVTATADALYGPDDDLHYGDGTAVNPGNPAEVQAFRRFTAEKAASPASRLVLQAYYREWAAA